MDLVLMGGKVLTMDVRDRRAEALAVDRGKIAAVGAVAEVSKLIGPETRIVDLGGRALIPGFIDPHNHFSLTTFQPVSVDCSVPPHSSVAGVVESISAAAAGASPGKWIWGWGFRSALVKDNRAVTREELDDAAPDNPVCIMDGSVHACYGNSAALKLAAITAETTDPPHGQIRRAHGGEANGTLWEQAMDPVYNMSMIAHMEYNGGDAAELVNQNCRRHFACGITSVGDALVVPAAAEMYRRADGLKKLPILLRQMMGGDGFFQHPRKASRGELGDGDVSDRLRGGTVKMFMDPVFPSAALIRHHGRDEEQRIGALYYSQDEANRIVLDAHRLGLQVAIHCLGGWSIDQALNAFENAQMEHPVAEPRFRIEHFSWATLVQIRRARSLGVVPVIQPPFLFRSGEVTLGQKEELGFDQPVFPVKTMLSEGVPVSASSDAPCAMLEPLTGLYALVTRRSRRGDYVEPEEAVTPLEALRLYTLNAAYALGRESEVGSLEAGKRADMVVLSHDITVVEPEFIREVAVEQTYVDGKLVFSR